MPFLWTYETVNANLVPKKGVPPPSKNSSIKSKLGQSFWEYYSNRVYTCPSGLSEWMSAGFCFHQRGNLTLSTVTEWGSSGEWNAGIIPVLASLCKIVICVIIPLHLLSFLMIWLSILHLRLWALLEVREVVHRVNEFVRGHYTRPQILKDS